MNDNRAKDIFKMLELPEGVDRIRLIENKVYVNTCINHEHVQIKIEMIDGDTPESVQNRIEEEIEAEKDRIEKEDLFYEHPSDTQGYPFDNLTC